MSAHLASHPRGWLSALVAHVTDYVFEPIEEAIEEAAATDAAPLQPQPVIAIVSAAPKSGATTVARMLAAELAFRADGAAIVTSATAARRSAPPSRATIRLATALVGIAAVQPCGRLCIARPFGPRTDGSALAVAHAAASGDAAMDAGAAVAEAADSPARAEARASEIAGIVNAARYLAPVVLDLPADGSAAGIATAADHVAVVAPATAEPPLVDAVAAVIGGHPLKVVNRLGDPATWASRVDIQLPDARIAARAAAMGVRPLGPLRAAIAELADALEVPR